MQLCMEWLSNSALSLLLAAVILRNVQADEESRNCSHVISRAEWGGRPPKRIDYMIIPLHYAIVQHTASPICRSSGECVDRVRSIESQHMDQNNWTDIGPSFIVGGDGRVYEGAGWTHEGAHTIGFNRKSVGIALVGDFSDTLPPRNQLEAVRRLLACGVDKGVLSPDYKLLAHRQVSATQSPGLELFREIQTWPEWSPTP